ncbi:MAG: hypothetical protein KatS3mg016_1711 [Fimbriimonadales bacterium]|nr:MAG: hypothetical protein KatS3mg016_1711 [Fimbriimonadales bacterium]
MTRYRLALTPLSPIVVGEWMTSRSNVRESLSYIPGRCVARRAGATRAGTARDA